MATKITRIGTTTSNNSKIIIEDVGKDFTAALSSAMAVVADPQTTTRVLINWSGNPQDTNGFYITVSDVDIANCVPVIAGSAVLSRTAFITELATNFFCRP